MAEERSFSEVMKNLKEAEEKADAIIEDANKKTEEILKKAVESMSGVEMMYKERIALKKAKKLEVARYELNKEVEEILKKAEKEANRLRKKNASEKIVDECLKVLISIS